MQQYEHSVSQRSLRLPPAPGSAAAWEAGGWDGAEPGLLDPMTGVEVRCVPHQHIHMHKGGGRQGHRKLHLVGAAVCLSRGGVHRLQVRVIQGFASGRVA
jgi:hypothetical protein